MKIQKSKFKSKKWPAAVLLFAVVAVSGVLQAQTTTQNYVRTRVPRKAIATNAALDALTPTKDSVMTTIQYIDGLGRPLQTVQRQASPAAYDIIQPYAYDAYGREAVKYLPYRTTNTGYGTYRSDALTAGAGVKAYYNPSAGSIEGQQTNGAVLTPYPFAVTGFEASPLGRVLEQGAPGASWQIPGTPDAASSNHTLRSIMTVNDQGTFSTTNVGTNPGSHMVALYTAPINANGSRSLVRTGNTATYSSNQLIVTITRDENWLPASGCFGTTEEYKDKQGHVVLKRTYNIKGTTAEMLSTYYVYDDMGNLCFVLPPGASPDANAAISQSTIDTRCYQYRYDIRGRLTQKKVPGKGWEFIIYNTLDQVVATQDSVQRMKAPQEWIITKYDNMGRVIITGTYQHSGSTAGTDMRTVIQGLVDSQSAQWEGPSTVTSHGYTSNCWPASWAQSLVISYYDSYKGIPAFPSMYDQTSNTAYTRRTTGLPVASRSLVLNTAGDYLWTVPYYDEKGQVTRTFTQHYVGGTSALSQYNYDDVTIGYNFVKQVLSSNRVHYISNAAKTARIQKLVSIEFYSYDHMGRRRSANSQLQDSTNAIQGNVRVSLASYNETGQLIKKGLHAINGTSNFLQNLDYRYNPRGWLTNINNPTLSADGGITNTDTNDQFGMELKYDNATSSRPQYNGNIATTTVKTGSVSGTAFSAFTYDYRYDKLNRLNDAVSTTATTKDGFHSEYATYDNMGNITNLGRYDKIGPNRTAIDTLTYTYIGNRVDRIDDASAYAGTYGFTNGVSQAGEYTYDGNGNQLKDLNKGLTGFTYNLLNLPQTITRSNGNTTVYVYDATGRKLRKLFTAGATTTTDEYINGIQYEYTGSTPVIAFIQTEEGRARKSGAYVYEYDLKDHLGNTRLTTTWDPADATQLTPKNAQHTDYYAFGYTIQSLQGTISSPKNEYLYNGKELQEETGLYDYGARLYDPVIGRWTSVDPLAEKNRRWSPYVYGKNNSIRFIDPDGMDDKDLFGRDKHNADGMYVPPTDRGAKDFEYNGEKTREDHEQNDDSGESTTTATSSASTDQSTDGSACNLDENDAAGNASQGGDIARSAFDVSFGNRQGGSGVSLEIYFTNPGYKYSSYQWIQTVSSTPTLIPGLHNPHVDGDRNKNGKLKGTLIDYPFYWKTTELSGIVAQRASANGATSYFGDSPTGQTSFMGEVTLVGISGSGRLTPLGTFNWGYTMNNGILSPVAPTYSPTPSVFQQNIINHYNNR